MNFGHSLFIKKSYLIQDKNKLQCKIKILDNNKKKT